MNQIRQILSILRPNTQFDLQKIRDEAEAKYKNKFYLLLTELEYLNEIELDEKVLTYVNNRVPLLLQEFAKLFKKCKTACNKAAPRSLHEDLEQLSKSNKYAYTQTCKSLKIIKECIQFNTLYSMFETRLNKLSRKLDETNSLRKPSSRKSSKKSVIKMSKTRSRRSSNNSTPHRINQAVVQKFQEHYKDFLAL